MGEVVPLPRSVAAPVAPVFEDPRWAELHRPSEVAPAATASDAKAERDCICTAGTVCRHNNACPRRPKRAGAALTLVGA